MKLLLTTVEAEESERVAMALMVRLEATRIGAWYFWDAVVGSEPSRV
jgi:hypothetical protein